MENKLNGVFENKEINQRRLDINKYCKYGFQKAIFDIPNLNFNYNRIDQYNDLISFNNFFEEYHDSVVIYDMNLYDGNLNYILIGVFTDMKIFYKRLYHLILDKLKNDKNELNSNIDVNVMFFGDYLHISFYDKSFKFLSSIKIVYSELNQQKSDSHFDVLYSEKFDELEYSRKQKLDNIFKNG